MELVNCACGRADPVAETRSWRHRVKINQLAKGEERFEVSIEQEGGSDPEANRVAILAEVAVTVTALRALFPVEGRA
jgi:hypothetical protein